MKTVNPATFVGRETALSSLGALIAQVTEGIGGAVWVQGPPGIGKSALIAAAVDGAEPGACRVRSCRAAQRGSRTGVELDSLGLIDIRSQVIGR